MSRRNGTGTVANEKPYCNTVFRLMKPKAVLVVVNVALPLAMLLPSLRDIPRPAGMADTATSGRPITQE